MSALAVDLRAVEVELSRATQAIQLHVQCVEKSIESGVQYGGEVDGGELLLLVESVERTHRELHSMAKQFLKLARQYFPQQIKTENVDDGEDTETEDEFEQEDQVQIKVEKQEVLSVESGDIESPGRRPGSFNATAAEEKCGAEKDPSEPQKCLTPAYQLYLRIARKIKRYTRKNPDNPDDLDYLLSNIDSIRRCNLNVTMREYGLDAIETFLELLRQGAAAQKDAAEFTESTVLISKFITTGRSEVEKQSLLMQFVRYLTDVCNVAKETPLAEVLSPLEKSRTDIVKFCCRKFPDDLEDVSNALSVKHIHRCMEPNHVYVYVMCAMLKFVDVCEEYEIKANIMKEARRTKQQWKRFYQIGDQLASLLKFAYKAHVSYDGGDASKITDKLKEVEDQCPKWIPRELLTNWYLFINPASTTSTVSGVKRSLPDSDAEYPERKRLTKEEILELRRIPTFQGYFDAIKQFQDKWDAGNVPFFSIAKISRGFLVKATHATEYFANGRSGVNIADFKAFTEASEKMTKLYCQSLWDYSGRAGLRHILKDLASIIRLYQSDKRLAQSISSLTTSRSRLQEYWDQNYEDAFQTMQRHVEETEKRAADLNSGQYEDRVQLLICLLYESFGLGFSAASKNNSSPHRVQEIRESLMEIGLVLRRWLDRISESFSTEKLDRLLPRLKRVELKIPGSVSPTLLQKVEELVEKK